MRAVFAAAEVLGARNLFHSAPPAGTTSRILKLRVQRVASRGQERLSQHSSAPSAPSPTSTPVCHVCSRQPRRWPVERGSPRRDGDGLYSGRHPDAPQGVAANTLATGRTAIASDGDTTGGASASAGLEPRAREFARALEEGSTRKLYLWLAGADEGWEEMVAGLPQTTFSEFVRCLDPFAVSRELDHAHGMAIGPGLAQFTVLGQYTNGYGVRLVQAVLLQRLMSVYERRVRAGGRVLLGDYGVLLRCAGAASDLQAAKRLWQDSEAQGYRSWRHSGAYADFLAARFLTERLYAQHDPPRFRVRPLNMHKQKSWIPAARLDRLDRLRANLEGHATHRFGHNAAEPDYAEHLTRVLRKTKPLRRVFGMARLLGHSRDERLLSALVVALGRNASLRAVAAVLADYWGVVVATDRATRDVSVRGGAHFPPDSPMRPTARLLEAVAHAYCCNGEVACALKLVDYLSRRYGLPVADGLWFDLLAWTYVMVSKPAALEWKVAGLPGRVLKPAAVDLVWAVMTSEPYAVRPGFAQYDLLIRTLIARRKLPDALRLMREMKLVYARQLAEYEDAVREHSLAVAHGVDDAGAALARAKRAEAAKWHQWYCFQVWCWTIFKKARPTRSDDDFAVRDLPQLVDEFRAFMPAPVKYRTATGYVVLREPHLPPFTPPLRYLTLSRSRALPGIRPRLGSRQPPPPPPPPPATSAETAAGKPALHELWRPAPPTDAAAPPRRRAFRRPRLRTVRIRRPVSEPSPTLPRLSRTTSRAWLLREFT